MKNFIHAVQTDIDAALQRDPAANSKIEIILCYPGFHAIFLHRISHFIFKKGLKLVARFLSHISRLLTGIEIHPGAQIDIGFFIDHGMGVVIGETSIIGKNCTIYHGVTLGGVSLKKEKRHPTLEDGVLVGVGARILGPHKIGKGVRIGAGSVVISDVPPDCTVVGVPARIVSGLSEEYNEEHPKISFEHDELPDPIQNSIYHLDKRIEDLEKRMKDEETSNQWKEFI